MNDLVSTIDISAQSLRIAAIIYLYSAVDTVYELLSFTLDVDNQTAAATYYTQTAMVSYDCRGYLVTPDGNYRDWVSAYIEGLSAATAPVLISVE